MKEKIAQKAADMFIHYGFKSVTMDDIAEAMGISKKTIYAHFKNKTELVKEAVLSVYHSITCGIDHIREQYDNPIEELYEIKKFALTQLKNERSSPQYQLQKYYPDIFEMLRGMQFEKMHECTVQNIEKGIEKGVYRDDLNVEFVSRVYFMGINGIKDDTLFPLELFPKHELMEEYLEYHLRGIVTKEGLKTLEKFIKTHHDD
ncbi:TetR/AcrR family transcriptional regulator [Luteirhabdus pelagi]|uniref:TetR/AcrR family transcriptional regulator n=1 Tax=Luteirhabdus pelagi TaxID=2792783 RepID=UPI00193AC969|nr:TetR/AcrR family transcriptional regulator [Luteirhabdus pelagi]MCT8339603.1 TetR/AcrR family transcriptional regulator [Thermobacterium salinum]